MKQVYIYTILLFVVFSSTQAQDIHFSNNYTNVLNLNPALTGNYKGKYRFSGTFRDQYRTVTVPYQTASLSFDAHKQKFLRGPHDFGYGILLNYDIAGDSKFSTIQVNIPLAMHIRSFSKKMIYSFGIMPGIYNNSLEYTYLRFPEQFDGVQYNPNLPTGESPSKTSRTFFNVHAGFQIHYKINRVNSITFGASGNNLTAPDMSYYKSSQVKLPRRWLQHLSANIYVNNDLDIIPSLKMQFQGPQQEYQFGIMSIRYTHNIMMPRVYMGAWMRSKDKDAIILGLGCNYNGLDVIFNYDINISSLSNASKGHGALELSLTYIVFDKRKKRKMRSIKCPGHL